MILARISRGNVGVQSSRIHTMGLALSALGSRMAKLFSNVKDARILLVGLDGAGKTTLLYKFKIGEAGTSIEPHHPTHACL